MEDSPPSLPAQPAYEASQEIVKKAHAPCREAAPLHAARPGLPRHFPGMRLLCCICCRSAFEGCVPWPEFRRIRAVVQCVRHSADAVAAPPLHGFADRSSVRQEAGSFPTLFLGLRLHSLLCHALLPSVLLP